jgi:hypothetical protein
MNDLTVPPSVGVATLTSVTGQNPFDVLFQPAKATLDAIVQMRGAMAWLSRRRGSDSFDPSEFLKVIPAEPDLLQAKELFRQAEHEPAPEAWTGIAVAMMVDSMPAAHRVSDAYVCSIVDGAYQDPEAWEDDYLPGFSYGVIARSIRQARRLDGLPTPGAFLEICSRHRRLFKQWRADVMTLMGIRFDTIHGECPF